MAIHIFNKASKLGKKYWIDSNDTTMDEKPLTGSFENGLGKFCTNDIFI